MLQKCADVQHFLRFHVRPVNAQANQSLRCLPEAAMDPWPKTLIRLCGCAG